MPDVFDRIEREDIFDRISRPANRFRAAKQTSVLYGVPEAMRKSGIPGAGAVEGALDFLAGVGSGLVSSAAGLADILVPDVVQPEAMTKAIQGARDYAQQVREASAPASAGQSLEQFAEYFVPVPGTKKLDLMQKGAKGIVRRAATSAARDALQAGGIAAVQSAGDPASVATAGLAGGAVGAAAGAAKGAISKVAQLTEDVDPARAAAAQFGAREGIPVDPATRTGSPFLRHAKKFLTAGPKAPVAEELAQKQSEAFAAAGERLVERAAKGRDVVSPAHTGQSVVGKLHGLLDQFAEVADQQWNGFRAALRVSGQTITVDRTPLINGLRPIYEKLSRTLTPAQKELSPAYKYLEEIMELGQTRTVGASPARTVTISRTVTRTPPPSSGTSTVNVRQQTTTTYHTPSPIQTQGGLSSQSTSAAGVTQTQTQRTIPARPGTVRQVGGPLQVDIETALADLHALGQAARLEGGQIARDLGTGLAAKVLKEYRQVVDSAVASANPQLLRVLNNARAMTTKKYQVINLMKDMGVRAGERAGEFVYEPAKVFNRLTQPGDAGVALLRRLAAVDRRELPRVGATLLQGLLERSSAKGAEQSFSRAASVLNQWNKIGPETKRVLFGDQLTRDLDQFFRLGKYLSENPNPSNTGVVYGLATKLLAIAKHPIWVAKEAGLELALGRYLFSTGGPIQTYDKFRAALTPRQMPVNPAVAIVGSAFRQATGKSPEEVLEEEQ